MVKAVPQHRWWPASISTLFSWFLAACILIAGNPVHAESGQIARIISLTPHLTELLYAIGADNHLVGTVDFADYPEAARSLPRR